MMNNNLLKNSLIFLGLGSQIAFTIVIFFFIGKQLDEYFLSKPYLTALLTIVGCVIAMYSFIKSVIHLNRRNKD